MPPEADTTASAPASKETQWKAGRGEYLVISTICVLNLIVATDATILVPVLPTLTVVLNGTTTDAFWAGSSYLLTSALFQPIIVAFSDDFGRRPLLFASVALFTIGTIICCVSNDFPTLLSGRAVQGIGGGGCMALNSVIITDIVPLRHRAIYFSFAGVAWAIGSTVAPWLGGLIAEHTTWRWIFYVNLPFCAISLAVVPFSVKLSAKRPSVAVRLMRFDWLGMVLFTASCSSFLIGITWGGSQFPWSSWRTIVPVVVGAVGLVAAGLWETYVAQRPFIRMVLLSTRSQVAAYFASVLQGTMLFCTLYLLPIYYEGVKNYNLTGSGVGVIPLSGSLLPFSIVIAIIIKRAGHYRWAIWSGWALCIVSSGIMTLWRPDTPVYGWVLTLILVGLAHGLTLFSLNLSTQALADPSDAGYATAMYVFMRAIGTCLGTSLAGTILQNTLKTHLKEQNLDPSLALTLESFINQLKHSPFRRAFAVAISKSCNNMAQFLIGVAALAFVVSLAIQSRSMDAEFNPEHVLRSSTEGPTSHDKSNDSAV